MNDELTQLLVEARTQSAVAELDDFDSHHRAGNADYAQHAVRLAGELRAMLGIVNRLQHGYVSPA